VQGIIIWLLALYLGHTCIDIRFGNFRFSPCSNGCIMYVHVKGEKKGHVSLLILFLLSVF